MRKLSTTIFITALILFALAAPTFAQRPFNKAEFVARRAKLFEKIRDCWPLAAKTAAMQQTTLVINNRSI